MTLFGRFEVALKKLSGAALRFRELGVYITSLLPNWGVQTPESSKVVASVSDSARLDGTAGFFATSTFAAAAVKACSSSMLW